MRVIDCDCGVTLSAANDDELVACVLEHVEADHADMELDEEGARGMVEAKAYSAMDS